MGWFDFLFRSHENPVNNGDPVKEEYERALHRYNQELVINDKDSNIWDKKCFVLIQLGRYEEAVDAGKTGVQLTPNEPELWDTLHRASVLSKNQEMAEECRKILLNLTKQKKPTRKIQESRKRCNLCNVKVREIIQCGPCGRYFCPDCWREHQWVHGKSPSVGISYLTDGSFSGFDGSERIKHEK